jgi:hypothetical protein
MFPRLGNRGKHLPLKIAGPTKQGSPHRWKFSSVHNGPRFPHSFQPPLYIRLQAEDIQNHETVRVCSIGDGEARYRKYERLKFGGSQAYVRSSD